VQVWNATTGKHLFTVSSTSTPKGSLAPWYSVAWSPDGKHIAIGGIGNVEMLDATTGRQVASYGQHAGIVHVVDWSPDGTYIAVGSSDTTVQIWNVITGNNIYNYTGHSVDVFALAWSPDSKRIASGSGDGTVQVWDATTGNHEYTYRGHVDYYIGHFTSAAVNAVAWSPDGKMIASGASDKTVQVWVAM